MRSRETRRIRLYHYMAIRIRTVSCACSNNPSGPVRTEPLMNLFESQNMFSFFISFEFKLFIVFQLRKISLSLFSLSRMNGEIVCLMLRQIFYVYLPMLLCGNVKSNYKYLFCGCMNNKDSSASKF
jgi:hypothetical protein